MYTVLSLNGEVSVPPESLNFTTETLVINIIFRLVNIRKNKKKLNRELVVW